MLSAALLPFVASVVVPALALQVPLGPSRHWEGEDRAIRGSEDLTTEWSLDRLPSRNGTDHLVFETVHSLLQHWPNTRMRNGKRYPPLFDSV